MDPSVSLYMCILPMNDVSIHQSRMYLCLMPSVPRTGCGFTATQNRSENIVSG